jgi:hypothetical protein
MVSAWERQQSLHGVTSILTQGLIQDVRVSNGLFPVVIVIALIIPALSPI